MILHLLIDDQFADYVVRQFSDKKLCSAFAFVSNTPQTTYFCHTEYARFFNYTTETELNELLQETKKYNAIVFHGLFAPWQEWLIEHLDEKIKIAWMFYGGEIYGQSDLIETFLTTLSRNVYRIRKRMQKQSISYLPPKRIFKRLNYCLTSVQEEYEFAKGYLNHNFDWLWYTYYAIEDIVGGLVNERSYGNNIWLGNSATIENNYFDILFRLRRIGIQNSNITIPLSYGAPWVRNLCLKVGSLFFRKRFQPLLKFLPREQYNAMMLNCSVMIQAHLRPNAHGNIITGLWLGMRVYLHKESMEYKFFKRIGTIIFSIEDDLVYNNKFRYNLLSDKEVKTNREILRAVYGKQTVQKYINNLVTELEN